MECFREDTRYLDRPQPSSLLLPLFYFCEDDPRYLNFRDLKGLSLIKPLAPNSLQYPNYSSIGPKVLKDIKEGSNS